MGLFSSIVDTVKFLSEPPESEDFGKSREEWQASKDAKRDAKAAQRKG